MTKRIVSICLSRTTWPINEITIDFFIHFIKVPIRLMLHQLFLFDHYSFLCTAVC